VLKLKLGGWLGHAGKTPGKTPGSKKTPGTGTAGKGSKRKKKAKRVDSSDSDGGYGDDAEWGDTAKRL
jgi:hypothetical protein